MTEKEVLIYIRGVQAYGDADSSDVELISEGTMTTADNGEITLTYQETELTGMEGTTTCITIREDMVVLSRMGSISSQMTFQPGRRHSSLYETAWGAMTVDIATSRYAHRMGEHGGILELCYSLTIQHQLVGENLLKIRVREKTR
jgi:uncharacterized beta-barrel protein YwiB (DUF1934 family)